VSTLKIGDIDSQRKADAVVDRSPVLPAIGALSVYRSSENRSRNR